MNQIRSSLICALAALILAGCNASSAVTNYHGLTTPYGKPLAHIHVTRVGFHLFGRWPLFGNAAVSRATDDFLLKAKKLGATQVNIDHAERMHLWFGFIPFTLVLTPVQTSISGDALA